MNVQELARAIVKDTKRIALVGASPNPLRDSHRVMAYLMRSGFEVIPVNPMAKEVLGIAAVSDLLQIQTPIDTVVCFRRSEEIVPIAKEAIEIKAKYLWMQMGVENDEAFALASQAGLKVVMDRCIMVDHRRFAFDQR